MNMNRLEKNRLSWQLTGLMVVVLLFITMVEPVVSQSSDRNSTLMRYYCNLYNGSPRYFLSNLNATLSSLHRQLTVNRVRYAVARTLFNGESVWGLVSCRGYVSNAECVACYNYAVAQLRVCGLANGAHAFYNDCDVRYENNNFYADANIRAGVIICGNTTSPQPENFRKTVTGLMSDLRTAAPRTSNYYAASTRQVRNGNRTVYAIAQCNLNLSQSVCQGCLNSRYTSVDRCLPSTNGSAVDNGCFMRYSSTPFFGLNQTTDLTPFLNDGDSSKKRSIIGLVVGGVCFLFLVLAVSLWCGKWKKTDRGHQGARELNGAIYYKHKHLELATNNFSEENIIGKGGFGEVFKATLDDKKVVAVKRLKVAYAGAQIGFENEILLIRQIRHRNLLGLLGWSSEGANLLLVLEYMPNGSLDKFLWGPRKGALSWKTRHDIILGIARGLTHLHKEFYVRIVHRDIKSSNILLDDDFQPKIADFGLARFQPEDKSHITTKFAGTLGYTAPEYILYGHLSDKVDTFSFGIVILEIISGRKCTYRNFDASSTDWLLEYAWKLYETKRMMKLVDETMDVNQYKEEDMINIIEIALLCTQSPVSKRPTMSEVVLMLQNDPSLEERKLTRPNCLDHDWRMQIRSS